MRKIFCFISCQENVEGELGAFLEQLDLLGDEIYLYTNLDDSINGPGNIISEIDRVLDKKDVSTTYVFMSDIPELFFTIYRLYHQTFHQFMYFQNQNISYELYHEYKTIMSFPFHDSEAIHKVVYTGCSELNWRGTSIPVCDYRLLAKEKESQQEEEASRDKKAKVLRKYYEVDSYHYLFEPVLSDVKIEIKLSQPIDTPAPGFVFEGFQKLQYMHDFNGDIINQIFYDLDSLQKEDILNMYDLFEQLEGEMEDDSFFTYYTTCSILDDAAQLHNPGDIVRSIALLSFLMQVTKKPHYLNGLIQNTIENKYLNESNRFFIWNQCKRYGLMNKVSMDATTSGLLKDLYQKAFFGYQNIFASDLEPIPKEERDSDLIVVFTIQFLSERHAPTRTTLERCYTIAKLLGKKLILINTREQYTRVGELVLYHPTYGNVLEEYNSMSTYQYKDLVIPYYQPSVDMPSVPALRHIIQKIKEWKPALIFSIGNGSMAADLCGKLVPQAAISVAFSTLATTMATFSVIGRRIAPAEWIGLEKEGYSRENIIESVFTFELNKRVRTVSREDFGIPKDKFVLVAVGLRLDAEIDDDFIEMINKTFDWGTHLVLAGNFEKFNDYCEKYPLLKEHATYIGYYDDILALMEICDLYINPRRLGGGFSIVEAFHEGKPGVSVDFGDVATTAGPDFCVRDYEEMLSTIRRYIEDKEFYEHMSRLARQREQVVTDSKREFKNIIDKIQQSPLYF